MAVCRLCLSVQGVQHNLSPGSPLLAKLRACLPLQVAPGDRLPQKVCDSCDRKLDEFHRYVTAAVAAEKLLLNRLQPEDDVTNDIKKEPSEPWDCSVRTSSFDLPKFISKCTQTETPIDDIRELVETSVDVLPNENEVLIKEEPHSPDRFENEDSAFRSGDDDASDDDLALCNIAKASIRIKVKNETNEEVESDKKTKKKKGIGTKKTKVKRLEKKRTVKKLKKHLKLDESIKSEIIDDQIVVGHESNVSSEENDKLWQCLTCFVYEKSRAELLQHYKDHLENPSKLSVSSIKDELGEETNIQVENKDLAQDFVRVQSQTFSKEPAYQCMKCFKLFINKKAVVRHLICHDDSRPFPCNICGRTYKRPYEILLHGRAHNGVKTLFCRYEACTYSTAYRGALLSHYKRHEPVFKYTCEICNKGFDVLTWFKEHHNVHTGAKPFSCNLCGKSFIYSRYLASHRKSVHPETNSRKLLHRCDECNEEFPYRKKLQRHMARVHDTEYAMRVLCDICGKRLSSKEHLKFHRRIHTGEKPHNCRTCGKSFVKKCNLTLHERIHSGERPHVCSHCGKAFSQRSTLVIHERYHSGVRPYRCEICSKAFVAKGLLSMHQKTCV